VIKNIITQLVNIVREDPAEIYNKIYNMRGISTRSKISIIAACLNDQKSIDLHDKDLETRYHVIYRIIKSLRKTINKKNGCTSEESVLPL
jgi:hypothetical protein